MGPPVQEWLYVSISTRLLIVRREIELSTVSIVTTTAEKHVVRNG